MPAPAAAPERTSLPAAGASRAGPSPWSPQVTTTGKAAPAPARAAGTPSGAILAVVCLAQFMVILDVAIVNLALDRMGESLAMGPAELQWVVNAYTIVFAGFLLLGGRTADLFGRKRMFLTGLTVFTVASLVGGFAPNAGTLIAARAVQGLGGAILAPTTLTVLVTTFTDPKQRGRAIGLWSAVAASAGAIGSLAGGVLTDLLSWRWVLFCNVPLGVLLFAGAAWALTESAPAAGARRRLDVTGAVTVTAGLATLVYGIVGVREHPFLSAPVLVPIAVGVLLLVVFLVVETRAAEPIMPPGFFRHRNVALANIIALVGGTAMVSMFFFLSLFLQQVLGYRPIEAGLAFLPLSIGIVAGSGVSTKLLPGTGPRLPLVAGGVVAAAGLLWLSRTPADATFLVDLLAPTVLIGLGIGIVMVPITAAATSGIPPAQAGLASGVISSTRQLGGAIGLATLVTAAVAHASHLAEAGRSPAVALAAGYGRGFLLAAVLIGVGTVVSLLTPGRPATAG